MNLLGALAKVGSLTMLSRILGFLRDAVIARTFGASMATDAFFVAFKLPNLLRRIFAEGAFAQAFVPILAEYKETRSKEATEAFIRHVAGMLSFVLVIVTALGILAAPWVIQASAPGFKEPEKILLSIDLLKITFPYILFISLSSFVGSILNSYHKFSIPAFTPTFLNISFIVFSIYFIPYFDPPVTALAWAVFVGGILQLGFQLPWLAKLGFLKLPKLNFKDAAVNRVMKQMAPAILGVSVAQISLVINTIFASYLQSGSVSWMYYADRLMELPSGVLGAALGTILLPTLSKHAANQNTEQFSGLLDWGLRLCMLLTGLIMIKVLAPGFYARQNIKTPVKIAIFTLICTQLMNLAFIGPLKHVGLSLAIGLGACINAGLLFFLLRKHGIYRPSKGWGSFLGKMLLSLVVMGGGLWMAQAYLPFEWVHVGGLRKAGQLCILIAIGGGLYFVSLAAQGFRPRDFKRVEAR